MSKLIVVLAGDGVGAEVTAQAERVLHAAARRFGPAIDVQRGLIGGAALDGVGEALPAATLELCRAADAVLLGAVGGPRWSDPSAPARPEDGLLHLRSELGLFANLRPIRPLPALRSASPLRAEVLADVDLVFVRELTGGLYFGPRGRDGDRAFDTCVYTEGEVERVARVAGELARGRRAHVTSVDKANVLETSRLWRAAVNRVFAQEFPDVSLEHQYVDSMAMHLMSRPSSFDVVLTENLFGDILSDEASVLCGSLGMLPSASLGARAPGLYEPVHGSAPDIAGRGVANPYAAILCVGLLMRHSLGSEEAARAIEDAVEGCVNDGCVTADIVYEGVTCLGTVAAADAVLARLDA